MVFRSGGVRVHRLLSWLPALVAIATLGSSPPARAEISPDAKPIVDRYIEAIGGRDALASATSVHGRGTVTAFGLTGTIETWIRSPDLRASTMEIGPLTLGQGFDGDVAWRTDPSGKVIVLDGIDRERAIGSAWFDANRWLEPDQGGGRITRVEDPGSAGAHDVLDVEAPNGDSRQVWVNRETGFIDRIEVRNDQRTIVSTPGEYREFDGLMFASVVKTAVAGMPANDAVVTFASIEVNAPIDDAVFARPDYAAEGLSFLMTDGRSRLTFDYSGRHLWVKASINGQPPADFIFDTGASITVIDSVYAASIGMKTEGAMQGQGAGALGSASLASIESIRVTGDDGDGVEMRDQQVAVLSINQYLEPFFWRNCAGVLGFNFISQFVCEIDYDAHTLILYDPETFEYAGAGEAIPMTLAGTTPTIRMTLDGAYEGDFRLDVGSSATVDLHTPFVKAHGLDEKVRGGVDVMSGGFGGGFSTRLARMKSIAIGPFGWKRPLVSLVDSDEGALASRDYAGNVGNRILERFKCTFDYERRVLYLEPGATYGEPDRFSLSGIQLARFGDDVKVMQVLDGSPAAKAGMQVGDAVLSIDGRAATTYTPSTLLDLFERGKRGQKVVFVITRGDDTLELRVKLEAFI